MRKEIHQQNSKSVILIVTNEIFHSTKMEYIVKILEILLHNKKNKWECIIRSLFSGQQSGQNCSCIHMELTTIIIPHSCYFVHVIMTTIAVLDRYIILHQYYLLYSVISFFVPTSITWILHYAFCFLKRLNCLHRNVFLI